MHPSTPVLPRRFPKVHTTQLSQRTIYRGPRACDRTTTSIFQVARSFCARRVVTFHVVACSVAPEVVHRLITDSDAEPSDTFHRKKNASRSCNSEPTTELHPSEAVVARRTQETMICTRPALRLPCSIEPIPVRHPCHCSDYPICRQAAIFLHPNRFFIFIWCSKKNFTVLSFQSPFFFQKKKLAKHVISKPHQSAPQTHAKIQTAWRSQSLNSSYTTSKVYCVHDPIACHVGVECSDWSPHQDRNPSTQSNRGTCTPKLELRTNDRTSPAKAEAAIKTQKASVQPQNA